MENESAHHHARSGSPPRMISCAAGVYWFAPAGFKVSSDELIEVRQPGALMTPDFVPGLRSE